MPFIDSADMPPVDSSQVAASPDERRCSDCGKVMPPHTGRGRPSKRCDDCKAKMKSASAPSRATTRGNSTAAQAEATMAAIYDVAIMGVSLFSPQAAHAMRGNVATAQAMNSQAFASDPKLAKRVASMGQTGGTGTFIIAQGIFIAPVAAVMMDKRGERPAKPKRERKPRNAAQAAEQQPDNAAVPQTDLSFFQ